VDITHAAPGGQPAGRASIDLEPQIQRVVSALEQALSQRDLRGFYSAFRATDLPFLGRRFEVDASGLFRAVSEVLHRLGGLSPAVALAVENHFYVTSAIATFPIDNDPVLDARRRALLEAIVEERLLVANTNSRVHSDRLGAMGTRARRVPGGFRINGRAAYTSLATEGDLLIFMSILDEGELALFMTRPRNNPAVEIGPYLFPEAMIDSDTRQISFHDLFLPDEALLVGGRNERMEALVAFEMIWHQTLIPCLYLGAAAGAIEEARLFLRSVRTQEDRPLAELDGMVTDLGRLSIRYHAACCAAQEAGEALGAIQSAADRAQALEGAFDMAGTAKYLGTRCAEEVVTAARGIVGARAFRGGQRLERLSQEVMFGPLGPEVNALIERAHGRRVLGDRPFEPYRWLSLPHEQAGQRADKEESC